MADDDTRPPKPKAPGAKYAEELSDTYDTKKDYTQYGGYGDEARTAFQHNTGYSGWKVAKKRQRKGGNK